MTLQPDPFIALARSSLEHDRAVVQRLCVDLGVDLLPAVVDDSAPGWTGLAKRTFDLRCDQLAAQLHRVAALLDEVSSTITAALDGLAQRP